MHLKYYLNRKWRFSDSFTGVHLLEPMEGGIEVDLPHTFHETSLNYIDSEPLRAQCVYQRTFFAENEWQGKKIILGFEGIAQRASVYINGVNQIVHTSPSAPFEVEISSKVNFGKNNLITVLVDSRPEINQPPYNGTTSVDYTPFGGIYRDVTLIIKETISIENVFYIADTSLPPDTRNMTIERLESYTIPGRIKSFITLSEAAQRMAMERRIYVRQYLNDAEISYQPLLENGETLTSTGPVKIWDIDSPTCYRIQTDLIFDDQIIDSDVSLIGFRHAVFNQHGFYLNGRKVKIRGIARQQSFPYSGYAMPESMQRLDARILKEELSVNAVRCVGEYPSPYFIDECDKRGILVLCEAPGYRSLAGEDIRRIHMDNVRDMILAGRNHPSIFLWGVRINGSVSSELDEEVTKLAHSLDPTRPCCGERLEREMPFSEDVYAYTDLSYDGSGGTPLYSKEEVTSDMSKPYIISGYLGESMSVSPSDSVLRKAKQIMHAASVMDAQAFLDDICGSFAMTMCDYITDADFASQDGVAYHGVMDMFRNKKPVAHLYSTQNNPKTEIYVYPPLSGAQERWEGFGDILIMTNADSVRIYRDDALIGEYTNDDSPFGHMRYGPILMTDFLGEIAEGDDSRTDQGKRIKKLLNQMATGGLSTVLTRGQVMDRIASRIIYRLNRRQLLDLYDSYVSRNHVFRFEGIKNGEIGATTVLAPCKGKYLRVDASALNLIERYGYDVIQVRIMVSSESGEILSHFMEPVFVSVTGPARVIGPTVIPLRGGMAGTYIRSTGEEGQAEVTISCQGLTPAKINLTILRAPVPEI